MKKSLTWLPLLLFTLSLQGQNDSDFVNPLHHCGFSIGYNKNILFAKARSADSMKVVNGNGFRLGIFSEHAVTRNIWISPRLETSFNNSGIKSINGEISYEVMGLHSDLMLHLIFKRTVGKLTHVAYFGPAFRYPIISNSEKRFSPGNYSDLAIDIGYSFESKTKYYIFSPEIRYSIGTLNINKDPILKHVYMHTFSILLNLKA